MIFQNSCFIFDPSLTVKPLKQKTMEKQMILTSVKMQSVMINNDFENEYFTPILRFGRSKKNERKLPLYLQDPVKVKECKEEIMKLKGETLESIQHKAVEIMRMFKEYSWKKPNN